MANPLHWPGKYFFYPLGNTSAVCLTRDLAPEEPARILLLGCGDPRHILYTIFCEPDDGLRTLDFTCCDIEPAVLARNVLLLSMIAVEKPTNAVMWNIFFHMYLDKNSHELLVKHCKKLVEFSDSVKHWNASPYASFIKMCTDYTLSELRRHWLLYIGMHDLPKERIKAILNAFANQSKSISQKFSTVFNSRSTGPLILSSAQVCGDLFKKYWKTGTTFSDPKQTTLATILNPTFAYSLGGEGCNVHYGTDPMVPFHLAALFGNAKRPVSVADLVKAGMAEFNDWCISFHAAVSSPTPNIPVLRFFVGEATAVCRALREFQITGTLNSGQPTAQWKVQLIQLSGDQYVDGGAPASFSVIDTSNLNDYIGLLNVLIAAVPLMSISPRSGVLYTESLLFRGEDATKEFSELLYADIATMGLLLDLSPVDYLAGFTSRSNTHELMVYQMLKDKNNVTQFHQVTTWKSPISGDFNVVRMGATRRPPVFDPHQLGTLLYDIYQELFEQEDAMNFLKRNESNMLKAISGSNIIHYMRESFVLLLKLVRDRLEIPKERWREVMDRFIALGDADQSMPMDLNNYNDLCAQLHRHGVYTVPVYGQRIQKIGRFSDWDTVPPLVRIILTIPRNNFTEISGIMEGSGTPSLHCDVRGVRCHNIFTAVHVAFGRVIQTGSKSRPQVTFEEDPKGREGTSPLVASFTMPARLLTDIEPMENLNVYLSVRSTTGTVLLIQKLGFYLNLFTASLMDESLVHILPEHPLSSRRPHAPMQSSLPVTTGLLTEIGTSSAAVVGLDDECELVASLSSTVFIEDDDVKRLFGSGITPNVTQLSPCVMRVEVGARRQDLIYPFPVAGSKHKLRLARKSLYIEVVVPVSGPFKPGGMSLNRFPVVGTEKVFAPWSIHAINVSRMPTLDIKAPKVDQWLNTHVGSMMSSRERSLRKKQKEDVLMFVKDTLHSIFVRSSGIQQGPARRLFGLFDQATNNCDTIIFISNVRFDLHSHTMICDGYVLPLTHELLTKIESDFSKLVGKGDMINVPILKGEMQAWKQLLPAFVERCRTWKHGEKCEYVSQGKIPLVDVMEEDPLCGCGRGKDIEGMSKVALWSKLAPYVTRIALSPLFAVSYLESVGRDPAKRRCSVCRGKGQPKLMTCSVCHKARYCSGACQKKDWKAHKPRCKPSS